MEGFKKAKWRIMESNNTISGFEANDISLDEAIKILSCKGVLNVTFKRYTDKEAFNLGVKKVWE